MKGINGQILQSTYENRNNELYINDIGKTIQNVCEIVNGGILVFFSSYWTLENWISNWKSNEIWNQIIQLKVWNIILLI